MSLHQGNSCKMKFLLVRKWCDTPTPSIPLTRPLSAQRVKSDVVEGCEDMDIDKNVLCFHKLISSDQKLNYLLVHNINLKRLQATTTVH